MEPHLLPQAAPSAKLWAGALGAVLSYDETGCPHASRRAADLLARLADFPGTDPDLRELCERASLRLDRHPEPRHVPRR
ncbi:hypothetical protein [Zoogloea sp.]|jgi:hypothetical protein|uniref:hypothetical protein n=1 Tax=Zoogloea sp. TaxID=49181 RepID=UPI0035AFC36C